MQVDNKDIELGKLTSVATGVAEGIYSIVTACDYQRTDAVGLGVASSTATTDLKCL